MIEAMKMQNSMTAVKQAKVTVRNTDSGVTVISNDGPQNTSSLLVSKLIINHGGKLDTVFN